MGFTDIILIVVIVAVLVAGFAIRKLRRKKGKSCCDCGCKDCSGCN